MDTDHTSVPSMEKSEIEKLVENSPLKKGFRTLFEVRTARLNHKRLYTGPNRVKQHKAKKLADAMRKRQRGCKQRRTGVKPKR